MNNFTFLKSLWCANGLFSKLKVSDLLQEGLRSKKSALERHHLFPKAPPILQSCSTEDYFETSKAVFSESNKTEST